jgi:class 3 adenylate cyclase
MATPSLESQAWLELPDGQLHWLRDRCAIGRQAGNDLVLKGDALSRQHALITRAGPGYIINDLRSRNGTSVNARNISRLTPLKDGDVIQMGQFALRFRCTRQQADAAPTVSQQATAVLAQMENHACWLLLADIVGSSSLTERLGREAAAELVRAWIAGVRPVIEKNGGTVNRYLGDAIFGYWMAESGRREPVLAALQGLEDWRPQSPVGFRVVVHHGEVLFTHSEQGEELSGQDVNLLFRAEKVAKRLGTTGMLSQAAMQKLQLNGQCDLLGRTGVDGFSGQFDFFSFPRSPFNRSP